MGKNRKEYIHNVARTIIGQIGGVACDYGNGYSQADEGHFPNVLWQTCGDKVVKIVKRMGPAARGRIVACGVESSANGSLSYHEVNESLITPKVTGDELLTLLSSYVVVAAIVDIIRADIRSLLEEEQRTEDELNLGIAAYIHGAHNHGATR